MSRRATHLYPEHSPVSWQAWEGGPTYQGRLVKHERMQSYVLITVAWATGGIGRFIEDRLPPGMVVAGASEATVPMPAVRRRR